MKLKKESERKVAASTKDGASKATAAKKKVGCVSDEDRSTSPTGSRDGDASAAADDDNDDVQWRQLNSVSRNS